MSTTESDNDAGQEPYCTFDFSPTYAPILFATHSDLQRWLESERDFFAFLSQSQSVDPNSYPGQALREQWQLFQQLIDQAAAAAQTADRQSARSLLEGGVRAQLADRIQKGFFLLSVDPRAQYVRRLWVEEGQARRAAYVMAYFLKRPNDANSVDEKEGAFLGLAFQYGLHGTDRGVESSLIELLRTYSSRLNDVDMARANLQEKSIGAKAEWDEISQASRGAFQEAEEQRTGEVRDMVSKGEGRLKAIEAAYNEHQTLFSATNYWKRKGRGHRNAAIAFAAAGVLFVALFGYFAGDIGLLIKAFRTTVGAETNSPIPAYFILGAVALASVWILRVLVRLLLSNLHLSVDSEHRRVLVMTYLALLKSRRQGEAVSDRERVIVLEQIFRPASDGLVKDDAMPPTPFELLTRKLS